jgi:hypothetical protein
VQALLDAQAAELEARTPAQEEAAQAAQAAAEEAMSSASPQEAVARSVRLALSRALLLMLLEHALPHLQGGAGAEALARFTEANRPRTDSSAAAVECLLAAWAPLSVHSESEGSVPPPARHVLEAFAAEEEARARAPGATAALLATLRMPVNSTRPMDALLPLAQLLLSVGTLRRAAAGGAVAAVVAAMQVCRADDNVQACGCCALAFLACFGSAVRSADTQAAVAAVRRAQTVHPGMSHVSVSAAAALKCLAPAAAAAADAAMAALLAEEEAEATARRGKGGATAAARNANAKAKGKKKRGSTGKGGRGGSAAPRVAPSDEEEEDAAAASVPATATVASIQAALPQLSLASAAPLAAAAADEAHEDDELCVCCLDAPRDTPLPCCASAHAPVLCAPCAVQLCARERPACPLCRAPVHADALS